MLIRRIRKNATRDFTTPAWNTCAFTVSPENYRVDELRNRHGHNVGNVIKQITRTGLKFNGCSRHRAYQRPALSRFSRAPFLSSHFHQVSSHRDKLYDCSFLRVPPRSTDLWSNHRSLSSSFYLSFFYYFLFIFFHFFEIYDEAIQNVSCSFLKSRSWEMNFAR